MFWLCDFHMYPFDSTVQIKNLIKETGQSCVPVFILFWLLESGLSIIVDHLTELRSLFFSAAYITEKSMLPLNIVGLWHITVQCLAHYQGMLKKAKP